MDEDKIEKITDFDIKSKIKSMLKKTSQVSYKFNLVTSIYENIRNDFNDVYEKQLSGEIGDMFEKMYSTMEYAAYILKNKTIGLECLCGKYNGICTDIKNEISLVGDGTMDNTKGKMKSKNIESRNKTMFNIVKDSCEWYEKIHPLRTADTHYSCGYIGQDDLHYKVSGNDIGYEDINHCYQLFNRTITEICNLVDSKYASSKSI